MATKTAIPFYLRTTDLAEELGKHPTSVEKCIYRGIIQPDAEVKHGRSSQPLFLKSRFENYLKAMREYFASEDQSEMEKVRN
jgi:hypothetical protein